MLFRTKRFIKFLLQSTNQHGVHSPFVFGLITKCFYSTEKRKAYTQIRNLLDNNSNISYKNAKLLNRTPDYLACKKGLVLDEDHQKMVSEIVRLDNTIKIDREFSTKHQYDLVYLTIAQLQKHISNETLFVNTHNDSVIIIPSKSFQKREVQLWNQIKQHPKITVTIDTFYLTFAFIRKEQVKEHFTIRL